jgi:hypothetical protein
LFEVKPDGHIVWEYWNPYGGELPATLGNADPDKDRPPAGLPTSVFRAARVAPGHPALAGRKLEPVDKQ